MLTTKTLPCPNCGQESLAGAVPMIGTCNGDVEQAPDGTATFEGGGYTEYDLTHHDSALYCRSCEWNAPEVEEDVLLERLRAHQHQQALQIVAAQSTDATAERPDVSHNVRLLLDASTAHVPETDVDWLNQQAQLRAAGGVCCGLSIVAHRYGWLITCPPTDELPTPSATQHPHVWRLLQLADQIGAGWVLLDGDAPQIPGLPTFDW